MSVSLNQNQQLQADPQHTLESFSVIRPKGAVLLVSICPKQTGWPLAQAFIMPQEAQEATDWAMKQNATRNVYFTVNMTSVMTKKAAKTDMVMATSFWSDCDPQVFKYKGYEPAREYLINNLVPRLQRIASFIIDSGNGVDPFFVLEDPINIDGDFDGYENLNKQIAELYEGPGTHNCDRVMRLPGTLNYPNDAKLKKGYPQAPSVARLIFKSDKTYTLSGIKALLADTELSNRFRTHLETHPAVAARYAGDKSELNDKSGSAMDFSMVAMLKLGGFNKEECRALLKDWKFGSTSDQRDKDRYWDRCWDRTSEGKEDPSKVDISVFLGNNDFKVAPQTLVREAPIPSLLLKPPGILKTTMQWMLDTAQQPQPILALTASLSMVATALANKVESQTGLRTNLYLVGVADTGAGKDHGRKCIKAAFTASGHTNLLGGEEIGSGQGLLSRVAREPGSIFQPDEFGLWLKAITAKGAGAHLQQIVTNLMKLFTSAGSIYTGTEYADPKIKPRVDIHYPCANLHATTTPNPLFESFSSGDVTSGALNRLLILFTEPARFPMRFVKLTEPPAEVTDWIKAARMMTQGIKGAAPESAITILMSQKAEALFADFYEFWQNQLEVKRPTGMHHLWGRAWEHASKIALVVACAKHEEAHLLSQLIADGQVVVTENDAIWAIDFVKYVLDRMEVEVVDRVADSEFGQVVQATKMAMDRAGVQGLTMRELRHNCRPFGSLKPMEQDAVLESLRRGEEFFVVDFKTSSGRGKGRTSYVAMKFREEFNETTQDQQEGQKDD